ncbi:MAG: hypothetical protein WDW38_010017 [Sanguina aurantia]
MAEPGAVVAAKQPKEKKAKPVLETVPDNGHAGNSKFARALASNDFMTREKGLQALTRFLVRKHDIVESDMLKIWKGLFYAFWHSDKAPVQISLAERLAAVLPQMAAPAAFLYFTVFINTMRREWGGIDRLRLDKFLMLIRKFVSQMFELLQASEWSDATMLQYMDFLSSRVLQPTDGIRAVGLAYHVTDVFLPELARVVSEGSRQPPQGSILVVLLQPFVDALVAAGEAAPIRRLRESIFKVLVEELQEPGSTFAGLASSSSSSTNAEEGPKAGSSSAGAAEPASAFMHLDMTGLSSKLFDLGALPSTRGRNREALYAVSKEMEKAQRMRLKQAADAAAPPQKQAKSIAAAPSAFAPVPTIITASPAAAAAAAVDSEPASTASAATPTTNGLSKKEKKRRAQASASKEDPESAIPTNTTQEPHSSATAAATTAPPVAPPASSEASAGQHVDTTPSERKKKKRKTGSAGKAEEITPAASPMSGAQASAQGPSSLFRQLNQLSVASPASPSAAAAAPTSGQRSALKAQVQAFDSAAAFGSPAEFFSEGANGTSSQKGSAQQAKAGGSSGGAAAGVGFGAVPGARRAATTAGKGKRPADSSVGRPHSSLKDPKKGVTINLKKNLYFEFGGPKAALDVRTPPTSRSKGGILKARMGSATASPRMGGSGKSTPSEPKGESASAQEEQQRKTPGSAPRAKANLFF